jgi:glycosyltransferase involved in cell wall biosynthesis
MPRAVLVHDNFTGPTGMGLVVEHHARWILDAGWEVTLVGDNVPGHLAERCEVVSVPPRRGLPGLPQHLSWCAAIARALRRIDGDVVHVHAPLLARYADLMTSHHLAVPAFRRGVREEGSGAASAARRAQDAVTRRIDDVAYRTARKRTRLSFVSEFLREEFTREYGPPPGGWILPPPAPAWQPVTAGERAAARAKWQVPSDRIVVGYAGGDDVRKGVGHLAALEDAADLVVLAAGPGSEGLKVGGRGGLGFVDLLEFYAACDVVLAPTMFDAAPVAVLQAVARGVGVVTTPYSGWAPALERHGAGIIWNDGRPLVDCVRAAAAIKVDACERFTDEASPARQSDRLLQAYEELARASS